jgi:hypothetical protein
MSLPDSRNRTYAANQRVARADLLWAQDILVGVYRRRRSPLRTLFLPGIEGGGAVDLDTSSGIYRDFTIATRGFWSVPILPVGARIRTVVGRVFRNGATVCTIDLLRSPLANPAGSAVATATGGTNGVWADLPVTIAYPYHRIEAGYAYRVRFTRGQAGDRVAGIDIGWDVP